MLQSNNTVIPDLYFSAFRSAVDVMNVYLGGLGRLQAYQIDAMQRMRSDQSEVSRQMEAGGSMDDIRSAQTDFARDQMERMATYWSGLYSTAYHTQVEVMKEAQNKALALATEMRRRIDSAPQGAEPFISALRLVADAAQSTCAAGVRATEEVERFTSQQMENVGNVTKSSGRGRRAA